MQPSKKAFTSIIPGNVQIPTTSAQPQAVRRLNLLGLDQAYKQQKYVESGQAQTEVQSDPQYMRMNQAPTVVSRLEGIIPTVRGENLHITSIQSLGIATIVHNNSVVQSTSLDQIGMRETHQQQKTKETCLRQDPELYNRLAKRIDESVRIMSVEVVHIYRESQMK